MYARSMACAIVGIHMVGNTYMQRAGTPIPAGRP